MTKEELEKEAEEWVISNTEIYDDKFGIECEKEPRAKEAYLAGAEPRENRIEELKAQIEQLVYFHNEDLETIRILNKLIAEMKCCTNCKHSRTEYEHCRTNKHEKWEITEK